MTRGEMLSQVCERLPKDEYGAVRYEDICGVLGYDPDCPQMSEVGHDGVCFPRTEDLPSEIKDGPVRLFLRGMEL